MPFEFENNQYLQLHGTAKGTKMAPAYANLFMGDLEQKTLTQSPFKPLVLRWRYIDHISVNSSVFLILLTKPSSSPIKSHPLKINFLDVTVLYAIPKISMLHNLSCLETRFRLLCVDDLLHSSLNLVFRQYQLHNIFIFGMAYCITIKQPHTFTINPVTATSIS